ncbi:COP1-interactive protein 1 isoform X3 [Abrus precatorius]|uniref:COP1-interactive protein 1 isoform X3 n=1 Tax=Abrus precatorius TaxID=3816 RepID=A0A8B8KCG5_ABRPR|nr:COP1-interactive protein 1 isoform X3 [Abrus precatorius]
MVKHRFRESIKSLLGSHIDPDKEEQLRGTKAEVEDKVKSLLKLIKDDNLEEGGTPLELSKKESLVELIEDFHNQYQSLHAQYDHLTGELRKRIKGKLEKGSSSSSSDSDSDHSSKEKDNKNGQLENEFQKTTDKQQELEVADLNRKLTITQEEKEDLNSKYLAALSKIQEAEKNNMDLKTDAEALRTQGSKLLVENAELNKQLGVAGKIEAELSQRLEDLKTEKDSLTTEKETALQQIDEEKKATEGLRITVDQLKDDKLALEKELQSVTGQLPILKQQLEHSGQEMTNIIHKLKVSEEEMKNEIQLAHNKIQELEAESSQLKEKLNDRERAISALTQMHEGHRKETSNQLRDLEAKNTDLEREVESLQKQRKYMEQLIRHTAELKNQLSEIQTNSNEREELLVSLSKEYKDLANESESKISDLKSQINNLLTDIDTLNAQKSELEEQIICKSDEASTQVKNIRNELNVLQQEVESLQQQKSDMEVQLGEKVRENSENVIQIQTLKEEIDRKTLEQERLLEDRENLAMQIRALESEVSTIKNLKSEDEEKISANSHEIKLSTLQEKLHEKESEASGHVIAFTAQIDNLQKDLVSLQEKKEELELHCEKVREEHAERLIMLENEKNDIASKNVDLKRTLEEREDAYRKLNEEYKQIDSLFEECKVKLGVAEKKIEEMAGEFHEGIESKNQMVADLEHTVEHLKRDVEEKGDEISTLLENVRMLEVKLRLSNQKLRVTEQLLSEKEDSFRKTEEKFQQDQRALEDRNAGLSAIITSNNEAFAEIVSNIKDSVNSVMTGIEAVSLKISDDCRNYDDCISNISHELEVAKDTIREMNKEKQQLKKQKSNLLEQLQGKSAQELALRKSVEKLEAKASKEESEKVNLTTTVVQLKKTVGELEKMMKEKEEGMLDLGEEKREVIRQLCLWIDYHRSRYDYLKDILSKTRRGQRAA